MDSVKEEEVGGSNQKPTSDDAPTTNEQIVDTKMREEDETKASSFKEETAKVDTNLVTDLYHYTKRGEFTSEIFKIEIQNLPQHFGFKDFKKMLNRLDLKPRKIKVMPRAKYAYVTFESEEMRQAALTALNGYMWKRKSLTAKIAKPVVDPLVRKRKIDEEDADIDTKKPKLTVEEMLVNAVTPLAELPYEEQLKMKQEAMEGFLRSLSGQFRKEIPELWSWMDKQSKQHQGMLCELNKIKPSPVLDHYRNKNEFSIGESPDGKDKTIGFRIGSYKGGQYTVANPNPCKHIDQSTLRVVEGFQKYLDQSELPAYDPVTHEGHWNLLLVRSTQGSDVMAMLQMNPQQLTKEQIEDEKRKLKDYFSNSPGKDVGVSSLFLNLARQKSRDDSSDICHHVMGNETITENLFNLKFRISKDSFFQTNTKAAETLYETVGEWAELTENATLLDVCCGTGTIGLSLAKKVNKVIGVELIDQAVDDANANAQLNGIKNAEFICGKAEEVLPDLLTNMGDGKDIIGIVDPPRAGTHQKVIHAIRRCSSIQRLVYLSCNPNNARSNFIDLCRPVSLRFKGDPFRPIKAIPVDMFPHTKHVELILLFQRVTKTSNEKEKPDEEPNSNEKGVTDETVDPEGKEGAAVDTKGGVNGANTEITLAENQSATVDCSIKTEDMEFSEIIPKTEHVT